MLPTEVYVIAFRGSKDFIVSGQSAPDVVKIDFYSLMPMAFSRCHDSELLLLYKLKRYVSMRFRIHTAST